ncbi:hypothetical protein [Treponema bryantii]|uniref:hypothetical protein n=1 Tax=Treponema bryantii TaxID=163 RepID=UPI002B2EC6F0|nr:hypothetical protein TRBR_14470 [Treponema bryantii]
MGNKQTIVLFTKEEVEELKSKVFAYCHWNDTLMNRFEDLFTFLDFPDDGALELRSTILTPPKLELKQVQRRPHESR